MQDTPVGPEEEDGLHEHYRIEASAGQVPLLSLIHI